MQTMLAMKATGVTWAGRLLLCGVVALAGCASTGQVGGSGWPLAFLGAAAPPESGARTIVIAPDTKWVNVEGGEVIRFVVGGREFGWSFDGPAESFDLQRVAPPGVLNRTVMAFVGPNPLYLRDGSR